MDWGAARHVKHRVSRCLRGSCSPAARASNKQKKKKISSPPLSRPAPHRQLTQINAMISKRAVILALVAALVATQGEFWEGRRPAGEERSW